MIISLLCANRNDHLSYCYSSDSPSIYLMKMNCAHLENCLHEAREEARTNKCSADRRAVEYDALRLSALRIHGLFERLNNCVTAPSVTGFAESLRSLAISLARCVTVIHIFIVHSKSS